MSATTYAETQIIAVVLNDNSGAKLAECRHLAPDAFADRTCRELWSGILGLPPGQPPGMALVGCGLDEPELRRIAETDFSSLNFREHVATVGAAWTDRRARVATSAFLRNQIPIAELAKELAGLDAVGVSRSQQLAALRFNPDVEVPEQRVIYRLGTTVVCTAGNLTNITAEAKAGKTAFTGAMIAAPMAIAGADCLGVSGQNPEGHALVHFDTETSKTDWRKQLFQAKRRAGLDKVPPWIVSYHLTGRNAHDCRRDVEDALALAAREFGKIFAVFIDGIGDLVIDPNDPEECFPLVTRMHELAIRYDTAIVNVLHRNPGTEKTRGHLGSQLERKAESNLCLEKDEDGATLVYGLKQRGAAIPKADGPRFRWSDAESMHVSVETVRESKEEEQREACLGFVEAAFADQKSMHYRDVMAAVQQHFHCKDRKAATILSQLRDFGLLTRDGRAFYHARP